MEARAKKNSNPPPPIPSAQQQKVAEDVVSRKPQEQLGYFPVVETHAPLPATDVAASSIPPTKANGGAKPAVQDLPPPPSPPSKPLESIKPIVEKVIPVSLSTALTEKPVMEAVKAVKEVASAIVSEPNPQDAERAKKRQNALTRTLWSLIMIGGFIGTLFLLPDYEFAEPW